MAYLDELDEIGEPTLEELESIGEIEVDICEDTYTHDEIVIYQDETTTHWRCQSCGVEGWRDEVLE